jgi:hypothetical protein
VPGRRSQGDGVLDRTGAIHLGPDVLGERSPAPTLRLWQPRQIPRTGKSGRFSRSGMKAPS